MSAMQFDSVGSRQMKAPGIPGKLLSLLNLSGGLHQRFALGALWSVAGAVVSTATTQGAIVLSGRILGASGLGVLALIQSTVLLGGVLGGSGLGVAATKHIAVARVRPGEGASEFVRAARIVAWVAGGLMAVVFYLCGDAISALALSRTEMAFALRASAPLVFLSAIFAVQQGVLAGFEDYRGIAVSTGVRGASMLLLTFILAPRLGLQGAIWALIISSLAGIGLCEWKLRSVMLGAPSSRVCSRILKTAKQLWSSALPMLVSGMAIGIGNWLTSAILAKSNHGLSELGQYYAADRWRLLCVFFSTYAGAAALPFLSRTASLGDTESFVKLAHVNIRLTFLATLPLAVVTALLAKPLMSAYGTGYSTAWPVLAVLALTSLPTVLNSALGQVLVSTGRFWFRAVCDIVLAAILLIVVLLPPIPVGALKLAVAQALSFSIVVSIAWTSVFRTSSLEPSKIRSSHEVAP